MNTHAGRVGVIATLFLLLIASSAALAQLSGTKSVGPSGNYATVGAAIADIQAQGLNGALILELQGAYASGAETFPLVVPALNGASATNTVTLRPASGATNLSIASNDAIATILLNGTQHFTIDGRAAGAGVKQLTIENTNASGAALQFVNEAASNVIQHTTFAGVNNGATGGVIVFGGTSGANGNDNNTIDSCDIRDGATTPNHAVYSAGATGTAAHFNSGNTVSNCNIFNFHPALSGDAAGVRLDGGNTDWTIAGNNFFQTGSRVGTSSTTRAIFVNTISGNNFAFTNNFIGGSTAGAGGTAWTITGPAAAHRFIGIQVTAGSTTATGVQGNTIRNFAWLSSSTAATLPGVWAGIYVSAGAANVGTSSSNVIGGSTGTGSISVTPANGGTVFGIGLSSSSASVIANNILGSMTTHGATTSVSASLVGVQITVGTHTISDNAIGSATTADSLYASNASVSATPQNVAGIVVAGTTARATIERNTIANLNNNYAGTANGGQVQGIVTGIAGSFLPACTIVGNTVRHLSTSSGSTGGQFQSAVIGIAHGGNGSGQHLISRNVVHALTSRHISAASRVTGIYNRGSVGAVTRNFVHSLGASSSNAATRLAGISVSGGADVLYANNMVRLGIDSAGASITSNHEIAGIEAPGGANPYLHNSVFIGGSGVLSSSSRTEAFSASDQTQPVRNNIFFNARANGSGAAKHYALVLATSTPAAGLSNHNILVASGSGGVLGSFQFIDRATLQDWQNATGQDLASASVDPLFVNASGAVPDLHLQPSNPAERGGAAEAIVTDDFDGETRSALTPTDIGADAAAFTSSGDVFLPQISYTPLADASPANRALTNFATITDNIGVAGDANLPRLYFKRSTDADVFAGNTAADNGWKFVSASNSSSPYSFTIDYALLPGGKTAIGNTIQYFVVAQDGANNLASLPRGATASAAPPVQNISGRPGTVNSYKIVGALSGTVTVCASGCDYVNLTGADGFFAAVNGSTSVSGDVTALVAGDLVEDGANALNQWTESGAGNYTIRIQPADGTMKTIAGDVSSPAGMIRLDGADRVTIDGRFNNTGRFLTFRNINSNNGTTLSLDNDASGNTIRDCVIEGAVTGANGVIYFLQGTTTGNDNNLITQNVVRDRSDAPGVPRALIYVDAALASRANTGNTISQNELFNFTDHAIFVPALGNESWTISGNTIYETAPVAPRDGGLFGIDCSSSGTTVIAGNTIHNLNSDAEVTGIRLRPESPGSTSVVGNRIHTASAGGIGIHFEGFSGMELTVANNQIALVPAIAANFSIIGIADFGASGTTLRVSFNSVFIGGMASGPQSTWAFLRAGSSTHTARNNIWFNGRTGGGGNHFAAGNESTSGTFSSNHNIFAGTGTVAENFLDLGTSPNSAPVSFATWQANTGGDANSQAGNPGSGHFTSAMFVNPALADLHIAHTGHPLVSNTGTPVAGVTTDYDGETRDATTPDIGSDEFVAAPEIAVEQPAGVSLGSGAGSVDFGAVNPGGDASRTFTIRNAGSAELNTIAVSFATGNVADFSLTAGPASSVQPNNSTTFTVRFAPGAAGQRATTLRIASNDADENPFTISLTGRRYTPQEAWRVEHFGSAENSGAGADANDFEFDGLSNVLEFAIGGDPKIATAMPGILALSGETLEFTYTRAVAAVEQGFTFEVEFADDVAAVSWSAVGDEFVSGNGSVELRRATVPKGTAGRRFLRLQVAMPQ